MTNRPPRCGSRLALGSAAVCHPPRLRPEQSDHDKESLSLSSSAAVYSSR